MMVETDYMPPQPIEDPPNLIRSGAFTLDRLLSHIDQDLQEGSEEFVRRIYEQRNIDRSSDRNSNFDIFRQAPGGLAEEVVGGPDDKTDPQVNSEGWLLYWDSERAGDRIEERRFAGAVGAHDDRKRAGLEGQAHVP